MALVGLGWLLARHRSHGGSLSRAAFLSARNDVVINVSIIAMAALTAATGSGWPDLVLGCFIIALALHAAYEVWEVSEEERLAAKALAGMTTPGTDLRAERKAITSRGPRGRGGAV